MSRTTSHTRTATSTRTKTNALTRGNITVTGGAGKGATTSVTVRRNPRKLRALMRKRAKARRSSIKRKKFCVYVQMAGKMKLIFKSPSKDDAIRVGKLWHNNTGRAVKIYAH